MTQQEARERLWQIICDSCYGLTAIQIDFITDKLIERHYCFIPELKVLTDEEIAQTTGHTLNYFHYAKEYVGKFRQVAQAQVDSINKQIEEVNQ